MNRTHTEVKQELFAEDPELAALYEASEPAAIVAREILRARSEMDLTQVELARLMNTSQSVVSRLENMEGSPNMRTVVAIANALGRRVELRFVDPHSEAGGLEALLEGTPEWMVGSRQEFVEGFVALVSAQVADMTDAVRRVMTDDAAAAARELDAAPQATAR